LNLTCYSLASFVTTYMEPEVEKLMVDAFSKNFIDYEEYPVSADIQNRCVNMIARLFNIPSHDENTNAMGTSTIGSSEAIMLATLAMKKTWVNKRKAEGKDFSRPNIIMNSAVQVCWEKAARYFDVEEKYVYCTPDRYVIDPEEAVNLIDENTIGICSILGTTFTGEYEDTKKINDLLVERNIDCPIHVDAASREGMLLYIPRSGPAIANVLYRSSLSTFPATSTVSSTLVSAGPFGATPSTSPKV
jgi:glutamate decarboxylase